MKFNYTERESRVVGKIAKPFIDIEILSKKHEIWYGIKEVLVDTGADISLVPKFVGEILVDNIKIGERIELRGIIIGGLIVYIHRLKVRVTNKEFYTKIAIADSDEVPAVLGRFQALDLFNANFSKGKELTITD